MPSKELELLTEATPCSKMDVNANVSPTLLLRRKNRPSLVARISLPPSEFAESPRSPPPTLAVMSPLPAANTLHAGHTPIFPRSLSPLQKRDDPSGQSTPEQDESLSGPLTLPPQPGDGTADRIELRVLDAELEKIAKEQDIASRQSPASSSPSLNAQISGLDSRKGSSRRSSENEVEVVDGVILKKPKMNMGAPLGQA